MTARMAPRQITLRELEQIIKSGWKKVMSAAKQRMLTREEMIALKEIFQEKGWEGWAYELHWDIFCGEYAENEVPGVAFFSFIEWMRNNEATLAEELAKARRNRSWEVVLPIHCKVLYRHLMSIKSLVTNHYCQSVCVYTTTVQISLCLFVSVVDIESLCHLDRSTTSAFSPCCIQPIRFILSPQWDILVITVINYHSYY